MKPKGSAGSWYAVWNEVRYPCVHSECVTKLHYHDPFPEKVPPAKFEAYAEAIRGGKVLLTSSKPHPNGHLSRDHYVALWEIDQVVVHPDQGIEFDLVRKLEQWRRRASA
jgi:hypothetical protein